MLHFLHYPAFTTKPAPQLNYLQCNFPWISKVIPVGCDSVLPWVIGPEKLGHFLKKIRFKIKPIEIGSLVFSQLQAIYLLCLEFSFAPCDIFLGSDWLLWYLWFWFCDITWNDFWLLTLYARNPVVFFKVQWNQQCMKITSWPMEISITIDAYEKGDRENNVLYLISY